ncbi:MAG: hypothetical protein EXS46_01780 [Candidatus Taylorbacteria bacterium]|nr:hypothetical protein [Candidatus Taylorbacteria bacterium]
MSINIKIDKSPTRRKLSTNLCFYILVVLFHFPIFVSALDKPENLTDFVGNFITSLDFVIAFIVLLSFFTFLTGILKYVNAGGDEERLGKAKQLIIYGILGLFVMFSFWGLASIVSNTSLGV